MTDNPKELLTEDRLRVIKLQCPQCSKLLLSKTAFRKHLVEQHSMGLDHPLAAAELYCRRRHSCRLCPGSSAGVYHDISSHVIHKHGGDGWNMRMYLEKYMSEIEEDCQHDGNQVEELTPFNHNHDRQEEKYNPISNNKNGSQEKDPTTISHILNATSVIADMTPSSANKFSEDAYIAPNNSNGLMPGEEGPRHEFSPPENEGRAFLCPRCNNASVFFSSADGVRRHMRQQHGVRRSFSIVVLSRPI